MDKHPQSTLAKTRSIFQKFCNQRSEPFKFPLEIFGTLTDDKGGSSSIYNPSCIFYKFQKQKAEEENKYCKMFNIKKIGRNDYENFNILTLPTNML